ncbi:protein neuralized, partial [Biomphalaria glabrata]
MRNDISLPSNHSMQFHLTHGTAIQLTEGQTLATRRNDTFCDGIVFFSQPIQVNQKVCVELGCTTSWSGSVRIGVTTIDPARLHADQLPKFAYPDWIHKEEFWIRVINESLTSQGCRLMVYINSNGELLLFVNGNHKGSLLYGLPIQQRLWLLLDIYGNTLSAKILIP